MDPNFIGLSDSFSSIEYEDSVFYPSFSDPPDFPNGLQVMENHMDSQFSDPCSLHQSPKIGFEMDSPDDDNHSNPVLKYLNQILLEENMEKRPSMFHDPLALRATEKSLYDALGEKYPSSPYQLNHNTDSPDSLFRNPINGSYVDPHSVDTGVYKSSPAGQNSNRYVDNPAYNNLIPNVYNDNESILQFQKGMEEASKFLVSNKQLIIDLDKYQLPAKSVDVFPNPSIKLENEVKDVCLDGSRGRKHLHWEEDEESVLEEEQRCSKQSAIYEEEEVEISELLDQIFLCNDPRIGLNCSNTDNVLPDDQQNGVTNGVSRTRRKANKSEVIDLSTLLVNCAQSIAANDRRTANELLKKIRQNSSTSGDACQRLAHVFANGLETRLAGSGTRPRVPLKFTRSSAAEILKAYQVYLSTSPFKLIPIFFANKMIADMASKSEAIHIVDFGICYGFQWPVLIQHLSTFPGGPPRLRITGIEYPQPGFRPAERVAETGQRLAKYCERFRVPFEYQAIATQNWEEIKVKDLKLRKSEVLVVNSLFRFKNLPDETAVADSPRDAVLKLIRAMNPSLYVNSVINGSYSSPFFVTRFREALYHYSSLFDMLDSTIPRESEQRMKFEQEFYGREVLNVVSCEGMDRVERPETYKQWQIRHIRARLKPLPLQQEVMNKLRGMVKECYHKDFIFDEDGCWMLQGWKGRIISASSCWIPA